MIRDSNPGRGKGVVFSPNGPDRLWGLPSFLFNGYGGSFTGMILTTHLQLTPRLRREEAIVRLLLFTSMAWTDIVFTYRSE